MPMPAAVAAAAAAAGVFQLERKRRRRRRCDATSKNPGMPGRMRFHGDATKARCGDIYDTYIRVSELR